MESIDVSSIDSDSSDWDVEMYKALNDSVLNDSATSSSNSRVLPAWASASVPSDTGLRGSAQRSNPSKRESALNGQSSSSKNVRNSNRNIDRHGKHTKVSSNNGTDFDNQLHPKGAKRMLPSTLQPSSSNSSPSVRVKDVGSSQIHENYGKPYPPALSSHTNLHMQDNFSRPNYDVAMKNHHGSRVLPPWMQGSMSVPATRYAGQSDPYQPGAVQETAGDERHIYEVALRGLHQPVLETTLPDGLLSVSLFRHQKIALAWMLQKENSVACSGGILADDQGLGKTISIIALIQMQKFSRRPKAEDPCVSKAEALDLDDDNDKDTLVLDEDKQAAESDEVKLITKVNSLSSTQEFRNRKPPAGSLVVCPASVLRQWARELDEKVADEAKLDVLIYHGGNRTKDPVELAKYDVVLTTYSIVAKEVPTKTSNEEDDDDKKDGDVHRSSSEFANKKRKQSHVSKKGKKGRKGIHSSAADYSGTLAKVHWFRVILDEAQTIKNSSTRVSKSCCGLRAKKRWCLSGTPIQNSIDELFSYFRFLKCEPYANHKSFCNQIKIPISRNSMQGYMKLQAVLKAIMLRRTKETLIDGKPIINLPPKIINLATVDFSAEERTFYRKLERESRSQFKAYAAAGTVRQNYANILLMLLRLRQACDHPLLVKGFSSESVGPASTKMAKNLPKDMQANLLNLLETLNICLLCSDPPEDAVITICGHIYCLQCVSDYLTGDDNTCPSPNCKSQIGSDVLFSEATLRSCISGDDHYECLSKSNENSPVFQDNYASSKIRATLDIIQSHYRAEISNSAGNGNTSFTGNTSSSSGIGDPRCSSASQAEGPIKTIVFSQWTRMLDLVEWSLNQHCIEYRRLDGSMSLVSRDRAVKEFNTDPEVIVMLMSLKAGNLGLNMVAASHVILLDLWWNPATEDQAIDRAHRIGQTRTVTVSRLTIKDTVEDRILALQEEKRKMVASAFGEGQSGSSVTSLTAQDLKYLFMGAY
ncbi:helicase-like transcription factor CHR28 isoform X1 [Cynara cardunculus var. scolymus]|nr:helicase-like transcription factor CHR28 isoform X1 [Cynara cardunculus var. scolymus]